MMDTDTDDIQIASLGMAFDGIMIFIGVRLGSMGWIDDIRR